MKNFLQPAYSQQVLFAALQLVAKQASLSIPLEDCAKQAMREFKIKKLAILNSIICGVRKRDLARFSRMSDYDLLLISWALQLLPGDEVIGVGAFDGLTLKVVEVKPIIQSAYRYIFLNYWCGIEIPNSKQVRSVEIEVKILENVNLHLPSSKHQYTIGSCKLATERLIFPHVACTKNIPCGMTYCELNGHTSSNRADHYTNSKEYEESLRNLV